MTNPKKPSLVGTGVQKGLLKTPVYDADHVDALLKAEREKALREAAKAVVDLRMQNQGIVMQWNEAIDEASDRIEALISEDATDG